ncbi:hypothetical protein [Crocosphaera sp. XPORK-15E]|uniref:hypothetical protein n=1 Tax=Crocosphaera sp. XPORK-15E TaxID=3110247 RepID=UPI002B212F9D|nr:hypothetical protein [Crocosphaera sp. XPORK-15E]MEA5535246.1 hypothetical protein [Crocosphaera sp. XPORK-15E]
MTTNIQNKAKIYDEFIDFLSTGVTPETLINFQYSDTAKERLENLSYRAKMGELSLEEKAELDKVLVIEHIITIAKGKAHLILQSESHHSK